MPSSSCHTVLAESFFRRNAELFRPHLAAVGLREQILSAPESEIPVTKYVALWEVLGSEVSPTIGLEVAMRTESSEFGAYGHQRVVPFLYALRPPFRLGSTGGGDGLIHIRCSALGEMPDHVRQIRRIAVFRNRRSVTPRPGDEIPRLKSHASVPFRQGSYPCQGFHYFLRGQATRDLPVGVTDRDSFCTCRESAERFFQAGIGGYFRRASSWDQFRIGKSTA